MLCPKDLENGRLFFVEGDKSLAQLIALRVDLSSFLCNFLYLASDQSEAVLLSRSLSFFEQEHSLIPAGQEIDSIAARSRIAYFAGSSTLNRIFIATVESLQEFLFLCARKPLGLEISLSSELCYAKLIEEIAALGYERVISLYSNYQFAIIGDTILINDGESTYRIISSDDSKTLESIYNLKSKAYFEHLFIPAVQRIDKDIAFNPSTSPFGKFIFLATDSSLSDLQESAKFFIDSASESKVIVTSFSHYDVGYKRIQFKLSGVPNFFELSKKLKVLATDLLIQYYASNPKIIIAADRASDATRLERLLKAKGILAKQITKFAESKAKGIFITTSSIVKGFIENGVSIVSSFELSGSQKNLQVVRKSQRDPKIIKFEMQSGDFVIHEEYGLGRFCGITTIKDSGFDYDCLCIEYHGKDKLFVPVEFIKLISKYSSDSYQELTLDKLHGTSWQKRKAKVKKRIQLIADELIRIAALRKTREAKICDIKGEIYKEFNSGFHHSLTQDQVDTLSAIEKDLSSGIAMNRLVCGDTGFGKTEVALRTAFIVLNCDPTNQVAVVTPTTLLARQLSIVFTERFRDFGVAIEYISGMADRKNVKLANKRLIDGTARIVIGTHAVLNCQFKNIVLLIIDEEHCFGVKQKEAIKREHGGVHVLYLSATPIPRTLHMSLTGIHDLSVLANPPKERKETRVFVLKKDENIIREAIEAECSSGGQVFVVSPRIKDIPEIFKDIERMVPEYRVGITHGELQKVELEKNINDFYENKFSILLTTTIVESGLDIPNANTIIVYKADLLGLSQLYQLKGRVGRRSIVGKAYFVMDENAKEKSLERIECIKNLKTSMEVAASDMDARGFGNLVGEDQAGHIKEVGIELYQQMLKEAINIISGRTIESESLTKIDVKMSKGIPEAYIESFSIRMHYYNLISNAQESDELDQIEDELEYKFGSLPEPVANLILVVRLEQSFKDTGVLQFQITEKLLKAKLEKCNILRAIDSIVRTGIDVSVRDEQTIAIEIKKGRCSIEESFKIACILRNENQSSNIFNG